MRIGYARVSTGDQHIDVQVARLREAGCKRIFIDEGVSGSKASRPGWDECLTYLREGDVLVSVKLDRWGRSVKHLIEVAGDLEARGIGIIALDQGGVDTTTPTGRLLFVILAAVAEFERELIIERTMAGLVAARARGKVGGRPKSWTDQQRQAGLILLGTSGMTRDEVAQTVGVSRRTLHRWETDTCETAAV